MSNNSENPTVEKGKIYTRDEILAETTRQIQHLKDKAKNGRFRDANNERLRDAKMRSLTALLTLHAAVLKDSDLDELKLRIEILENRSNSK